MNKRITDDLREALNVATVVEAIILIELIEPAAVIERRIRHLDVAIKGDGTARPKKPNR